MAINFGDTVVLYANPLLRYLIDMQPNTQIQTKFGIVKAEELKGKDYGTRFECKKGWLVPLKLTPELWTQTLPHRTQILYQADLSLITLKLDIKPGSVVVEAGTGSGSMSHFILRACMPNGHLFTYDICDTRVQKAQDEFDAHGYGQNVTVTKADACEDGFPSELDESADACILDLPRTWEAISSAYSVLKSSGSRLCTFSPCIEQVKRNVAKMEELGLNNIETVEVLMRRFHVTKSNLRIFTTTTDNKDKQLAAHLLPKSSQLVATFPNTQPTHSGFLTFAHKGP